MCDQTSSYDMPLPVFPQYQRRQDQQSVDSPSRRNHVKKSICLDVLVILLLLVLSLLFYRIIHPTTRHFRLDDPSLMYPVSPILVPSPLVGALSFFIPAVVIFLCNLFFWWNVWDLYAGLIGLFFAWSLALFFTGLLWVLIGDMRPFWLNKCQVDKSRVFSSQIYYTRDICLNNDNFKPDDFHGFPSGHGSSAFVGFVFLICYLNGKVKTFYGGGHVWKSLVFIVPLSIALWLSLQRLADHSHSGLQMFAGIVLGTLAALFAYRLFYSEGFWFGHGRNAHIPAIEASRHNGS